MRRTSPVGASHYKPFQYTSRCHVARPCARCIVEERSIRLFSAPKRLYMAARSTQARAALRYSERSVLSGCERIRADASFCSQTSAFLLQKVYYALIPSPLSRGYQSPAGSILALLRIAEIPYAAGRVKLNVLPSPGTPLLQTLTVPPSRSTMRFTMDKPSPCPPARACEV